MGKTKAVALMLLSIALVLAAAACGGSGKGDSPSPSASPSASAESSPSPSAGSAGTVTVKFSEVIRSIFYAPHYIAISKGFFEEQGLKIDMNTAQGSDKGAAALIAGTADISLVGPETAIYIHNQKGAKTLKIFAQLTVTDGSFLLSRNKLDAFKWSDLEGKTVIGWRPGSSPQMVMNSMLQKEKVQGVNVVTNIASTAMTGAFASGQGDFIQLFEPVASTLVKEGKAYYAASLGESFGPFPETSYVATSDYIAKHPDVVAKFAKAVHEGAAWLETASEADIVAALKPFFDGTPEDMIAQSVANYKKQGTWSADQVLTPEQFETLQNVLIENGTLKAEEKIAKLEDVADLTFVLPKGN
ncbi:ABC transporter substrate-binding protein [Cohnella sp. REN36]|uniref:ABC transporter substrate-binding protein n=1 Tax=Cohnella sp. REN36 TaxID=2887347 RepID=UPI001D13702E|nr:ABC transporter substrate-binding protein [Cohnella sp. REN36]MCC3376881.1 ABC transporter substrate-binding protein [Cohnella sp. REN36]